MGFFKDLKKLSDQSKEVSKDWDPAAQMRQASAAIEATTEMMAQQTAAARIAESGEPASARVSAARDTCSRSWRSSSSSTGKDGLRIRRP